MFDKQLLHEAEEKAKGNESIDRARTEIREAFQRIFDEVLDHELTYDEMLMLAEAELNVVYLRWEGVGEPFHAENPETDDPFGRSPEFPH